MPTKLTVNLPDKTVDDLKSFARSNRITVTEAFKLAISRHQFMDQEVAKGNKILLESDSLLTALSTFGRTSKVYREVIWRM